MDEPRLALAHDYLNQYGGAERVVEVLHDMYPDAPVYTSMFDPDSLPQSYSTWDVRTSFLQHAPGIHRRHQPYLPLYPLAFRFLRIPNDFDVLLSSSSAWGKGVSVDPSVLHICYCHSPMRFAWDFEHYAERERIDGLSRRLVVPILRRLRNWDCATASRVHFFIANSRTVQARIREYWGRDSVVINPPVDIEQLSPANAEDVGDFFVMVSRLVPYKRLDIAIEAANRLGIPLKIIGDGRARAELENIAGPTVEFLGRVEDAERNHLFARCRAAIFPAEDDFGIAQVEVQAAGRPVIAFDQGGAQETVIDGVTGVLFSPQSADGLIEAIQRLEQLSFSSEVIVEHARQFGRQRFEREIRMFVLQRHAEHRRQDVDVSNSTSERIPTVAR